MTLSLFRGSRLRYRTGDGSVVCVSVVSMRMASEADVLETDEAGVVGYGRIILHDAEALNTAIPPFSNLPIERQLAITRLLVPISVHPFRNTATIGQFETLAEKMNPNLDIPLAAGFMAFGTDNSVSASPSDTSLNNEGYRTGVTEANSSGDTLQTTTFLSATEANDMNPGDNYIREIGLCTHGTPGEGRLLSHTLVDPEPKSNQTVVTTEYNLRYTT